jgi:hypothetical protein
MKLLEFQLRENPPIRMVDVADLTEVVVFAGPNGVGKTRTLTALLDHFQNPSPRSDVRIKIASTTAVEREHWQNRDTLDTSDSGQAQLLRSFLQRPQKRGELRGGVLNFDSSRSFENIQPYQWSWDFQDPFQEPIGWNFSFQPVRNRFQDVTHSMLRKVRSHKEAISDRAIAMDAAGEVTMPLKLGDPLQKFKQAFSHLLPGKTLLNLDQQMQTFQYRFKNATLPLTTLSSGEREVVTIVFDFLLRDPQDCIVVFDEPELHLHPELSYRLLRTLREAGERNQFIFCTHSPDIIAASLDQTVVFIAPASEPPVNQAITVREDDDSSSVLNLLGHSVGVISLGQRLVLIEGENKSLDKQTYGAIVGFDHPELVLVPSGGKGILTSFAGALDTVLSKTLWGIDWFMLADGDAVAISNSVAGQGKQPGSRFRRLPRYHLENYFLDEEVLAAVFADIEEPDDSWLREPSRIRDVVRELALPMVSYGAALRIAHQIRLEAGKLDLMPKGCHGLGLPELLAAFESRRSDEKQRIESALDATKVNRLVEAEVRLLSDALRADDEAWKCLLPGRPILAAFAKKAKIEIATLKRLYIRRAKGHERNPFADIRAIFGDFARLGSTLPM